MTVGSAPSSSPTASLTRTPLRRSTATSWRIARPSADKFWTSHNPVIPNIKCHPCYSKTKVHWRPSMVFYHVPWYRGMGTATKRRPVELLRDLSGHGTVVWVLLPNAVLWNYGICQAMVPCYQTPSCTTPGFVRPWYRVWVLYQTGLWKYSGICAWYRVWVLPNAVLWNYSGICQAMVPWYGYCTKRRPVELLRDLSGHGTVVSGCYKRRPVELLRDLSGHGTVVWVLLPNAACGTTPEICQA